MLNVLSFKASLKKLTWGLAALLLLGHAAAGELFEQRGEIFYRGSDGKARQLSAGGHNSGAVQSRDGKLVAYVHIIPWCITDETSEISELWLTDMAGHAPRRLLQSRAHDDPQKNLTHINTLVFSREGTAIYFLTEAWVTSNAVHKFDLLTQQQSYITDGNDLSVVGEGQYAGYLVVTKHEYLPGGGSLENDWLVTPNGQKLQRWNR